MNLPRQIARQLRDVWFDSDWIAPNLKSHLVDITWQQATTTVHSFNTIAALLYHMNYYVRAIANVLRGGPLDAHDRYSFDLPPISSQQEWEQLRENCRSDAETLAALIEQLPEDRLWETFVDEKYGTYYRNLLGIVEHSYYHLGQIALIRKLLPPANENLGNP